MCIYHSLGKIKNSIDLRYRFPEALKYSRVRHRNWFNLLGKAMQQMTGNTEQQLIVGDKFRVWWDEEEGIIRNRSQGDFDEGDARSQMAAILEIAESRPGKVLVLNDLTEAGKASSGARKAYIQMLESDKVARHAFVGMGTLTRVIVSFLVRASGAENARFFASEEEALKWLKAD